MRLGSNHFYHLQECFKAWHIRKLQRRSFSCEGFDHFVLYSDIQIPIHISYSTGFAF